MVPCICFGLNSFSHFLLQLSNLCVIPSGKGEASGKVQCECYWDSDVPAFQRLLGHRREVSSVDSNGIK